MRDLTVRSLELQGSDSDYRLRGLSWGKRSPDEAIGRENGASDVGAHVQRSSPGRRR